MAQWWKILPKQETWVQSLGQENPLEEEMATHSSILAWRIPWTEEAGGLQSMGSPRVGHNWATEQQQQACRLTVKHIQDFKCVCVCVCMYKISGVWPVMLQIFTGDCLPGLFWDEMRSFLIKHWLVPSTYSINNGSLSWAEGGIEG